MKNMLFAITAMMNLSIQAHAVSRPDWNRPVLSSEMSVLEAEGIYTEVEAVQVTVTQKQSEAVPSMIEVRVDGNLKRFPVVENMKDRCGSTVLLGEDTVFHIMSAGGSNSDKMAQMQVEFFDHSLSRCKAGDLVGTWEAEITAINGRGDIIGRMVISGHPEPVYSIQPQPAVAL